MTLKYNRGSSKDPKCQFYNLKSYIKIYNIMLPAELQPMPVQHTLKLLIENKLIICALGNLHYKISREKFFS